MSFAEKVFQGTKLDEDHLIKIVQQISEEVSGTKLDVSESYIKETLERIDPSGRPLYAYFLGQELAHNTNTRNWSRNDLLRDTLKREWTKWWKPTFEGEKLPLLEQDRPSSRLALLAGIRSGASG